MSSLLESARRRFRHSAGTRTPTRRSCSTLLRAAGRRLRRIATGRGQVDPRTTRSASAPIARVDDFDGSIALVVVHHTLDESTIAFLQASVADLAAGQYMHLDLTDAPIATLGAMRCLEQFLSHVEDRCVGLRVVGLDPTHPLLAVPAT